MAAETLNPLINIGKRTNLPDFPWAAWARAWKARLVNGPTGQVRKAMLRLGLKGNGLTWTAEDSGEIWNPRQKGPQATENWLVNRWQQCEARKLAQRRNRDFGHLAGGVDILLTHQSMTCSPKETQGAVRTHQCGDTYTDAL